MDSGEQKSVHDYGRTLQLEPHHKKIHTIPLRQ